jgi:hypothetical protein
MTDIAPLQKNQVGKLRRMRAHKVKFHSNISKCELEILRCAQDDSSFLGY